MKGQGEIRSFGECRDEHPIKATMNLEETADDVECFLCWYWCVFSG